MCTIRQQAFIDIRLRPGITTPVMAVAARCSLHVWASRPLRPNVMSSIKPEVHKVVQLRWMRTKPQSQGICMKISAVVPEICSCTDRHTHTDRQTYRQTNWSQYSTPLPRQSNKISLTRTGQLDGQVKTDRQTDTQDAMYHATS